MGKVETIARKTRRKRNLQRAVLLTVGAAGLIAVAAAAPKAIQLLETIGINAKLRYRAKNALGRLKQKGKIEFIDRGGKKYARLTARGKMALALEQRRMNLKVDTKRRWDRRYRLVIFDVPEKRKGTRNRLRLQMRAAGFLRVQDSAWIYPFDCEEFVALLKADLHIGKDVLYAVIESIENDAWICAHFNLTK